MMAIIRSSRSEAVAAARILTTLPKRNPSIPSSLRNTYRHFPCIIRRRTATSFLSLFWQQGRISHRQINEAGPNIAACLSTRVSMNSNRGNESDRIIHFALSSSSVLKIQKGDITKWFVDASSDAIVNAANERMLGGGGVDGAIHRAAGTELRSACYAVPEVRPGVRCPKGDAKITPAFRLPVSHLIHTVGPIYDNDDHPEVTLRSAYRNCLRLCKENNIQYVAFPAISCGVYGYPYDEAASVAISTVKEFVDDLKEVHFVLFEDAVFDAWMEKANELI